MNRDTIYKRWGLLWSSNNRLDGKREWLLWEAGALQMFHTRQEARQFTMKEYSYIKTRQDLRHEPHNWRLPVPVKLVAIEWTP